MIGNSCDICGDTDLYSECSRERVCSICKIKFIGGLTATPEKIRNLRLKMGLADDEFLKHDAGEEARKILGRKR